MNAKAKATIMKLLSAERVAHAYCEASATTRCSEGIKLEICPDRGEFLAFVRAYLNNTGLGGEDIRATGSSFLEALVSLEARVLEHKPSEF